jgi:hypothetical protein
MQSTKSARRSDRLGRALRYVVSLVTAAHKAGRLRGFTMFINFRLLLLL